MNLETVFWFACATAGRPAWSFLTNHAQVLLWIAEDQASACARSARGLGSPNVLRTASPSSPLRDMSPAPVGGRRNRYTVHSHLPLPDPLAHDGKVGDLVAILARRDEPILGTGGGPGRARAALTRAARPIDG